MIPSNFYPKVRLLAIVGGLALAACVLGLMATHKPAESAFPGGNGKIAFDSFPATGSEDNDTEIYTVTSDGKVLMKLTNDPYEDLNPTFSADGRRIAFSSNRHRLMDYDIFTMNTGGTGLKNVTNNSAPLNEGAPAWSPNGQKIAFERFRIPLSGISIYVRKADGTKERRLTEDTGNERSSNPSWSPDGSKIVFDTNREGPPENDTVGTDLWVMNANGTGERKFFTDPLPQDCNREQPDWSPDGTKVVFVYTCHNVPPPEGNGIYVADSDGSDQKRLVGPGRSPVWSPNGQKIAFVRLPDDENATQVDVFVMRSDGTNVTNYTNTPEVDEGSPSWQPVIAPSG